MKNILTILLLALSFITHAQGWQWARRPSTTNTEVTFCTTDTWGNVYSGSQAELVSYDSSGHLRWLIANHGEYPLFLSSDDFGNLYELVEYTASSITIDGHILTNSDPPKCQFAIIKRDTSGNVRWARNLGTVASTIGFTYYSGIVTDHAGNVFVTTPFCNNPVLGTFSFTNHGHVDSTNDILLAKLDSSGNAVWAKSYGGRNNDFPTGVVLTGSGSMYLTGNFASDSIVFGSTVLIDTSTYIYRNNLFTARISGFGNTIWAKKEGGTSPSVISNAVATDNDENAYITGYFSNGSINFGTFSFLPPYLWYINYGFVVKYDSSGNAVWAKKMQNCYPSSVNVDLCQNVWITGAQSYATGDDTVDGHIVAATCSGVTLTFIVKWDAAGSYFESSSLCTFGGDKIGLAFDCRGNVYISSDYEIDTLRVGVDTLLRGSGYPEHTFVAKYRPTIDCDGCAGSLSVSKYQGVEKEVNIYPCPAHDELVITSSYPVNDVQISNLYGQVFYSAYSNSKRLQLNISSFPSGHYIVRINGTEVRRFVKQ